MADLLWCEPNKAKWVGVRPGMVGDKLYEWAQYEDVMDRHYRVPAGKTFLLFYYNIYASKLSNVSNYVAILDPAGAVVFMLYHDRNPTVPIYMYQTLTGNPIIEMDEGWDIYVGANGTNNIISLSTYGILVDNNQMEY